MSTEKLKSVIWCGTVIFSGVMTCVVIGVALLLLYICW